MGERIHIGADAWKAKDGTAYYSDEAGFVECEPKHAKELKGGMSKKPGAKAEKKVDYTSWNKDKLKNELEARGLDSDGNKDDLIARIVGSDG